MSGDSLLFSTFLIFTGAALFATLAMFARQALPLAYILLGVLAGPWGLGLVAEPDTERPPFLSRPELAARQDPVVMRDSAVRTEGELPMGPP